MKLLMIEHCPILAALMEEADRKACFDCWRETGECHLMIMVKTGQTGLIAARQAKYDLIMTETDLPDISGFEVATQIKKEGKNCDTPIIGFVDERTEKTKEKALQAGMVDVLPRLIKTCYLQSICSQTFGDKICKTPCIEEKTEDLI